MERILFNGKFATMESEGIVSALLIREGRIAALGTLEEVERQASSTVSRLDMEGKVVLPGIVDSHNHILTAGIAMDGVLLFDARNIADACEIIRDKAESLPGGAWIEGAGWVESIFDEKRPLTLKEMDQAAPNNPMILHRLFGGALANTKALELAGIGRGSSQPPSGTIERDANGNPTGYLKNGAESLVTDVISQDAANSDPLEKSEKAIIRATKEYVKYGITTVLEPGVSPIRMRAYQMTRDMGLLPIRVAMMPSWHGFTSNTYYLAELLDYLGVVEGFGDEWLRIEALKMGIDGGVGSKTALMNEPWVDGTRTDPTLRLDITKLEDYFREAHDAGWSIGIHCCGDKAQDIVLRAFDKVMGESERKRERPHRNNIIHGYLPTEEALEIMVRRNIGVSVQPGFIYIEGDTYRDNITTEMVERFIPLKTYLHSGIPTFANSDMISAHYNPFLGIYSSVTRRTRQGDQLGSAECLTVEEALPLFTKNGAYYCGLEDTVGSLKVGKAADLAVLDRDIFTIPSEEIKDIKVTRTIIDGKDVYFSGK